MDDPTTPRTEISTLLNESLKSRGWQSGVVRDRRVITSPDGRLVILRDACTLGEIIASVTGWRPLPEVDVQA
jgi:hypothetical protein